jgi:hypothetical protein
MKSKEYVGWQASYYHFGWRPIVSDKQATQLLRIEIKHHARFQQRCYSFDIPLHKWDYRRLLEIKKGNWYKIMKNRENSLTSILIRIPPKKEKTRE